MMLAESPRSPEPKKVFELEALARELGPLRALGRRIVHAHGVFDLLHVGHIRHLREARSLGDVLVVTVPEDKHVNKGPHRPAFTETLRAEALAALSDVDYVAVNRNPTAIEAIRAIRPSIYVKGPDYKEHAQDITGMIAAEEEAVRDVGGRIAITEDMTFSSSQLLNQHFATYPEPVEAYLRDFRSRWSAADVLEFLDRLRQLRVVVVGEAILDEYVYVDQMGKSAKDPVLAMRYDRTETYAGGSLAVANHLASFCKSVELVTYLGEQETHEAFVRSSLRPGVRPNFILKKDSPTIVKRRYVEATLKNKLFEVYRFNDVPLSNGDEDELCSLLEARLSSADAIVCADFGHGLLGKPAKTLLSESGRFLAVNTQINAANIRFHAISSYDRADYVCINEGELRLDARDRTAPVENLVEGLSQRLRCSRFLVTRGPLGADYRDESGIYHSPSLATSVVDRVGAGDAVLAITSACIAAGVPPDVVAFVANVIGAQKVRTLGNSSSIERVPTLKFVQALLK
jgi:rfaE bifunctional protein kinase chain/domain/rfaE bifunctional protein nucleotidyltransferase chain/domain